MIDARKFESSPLFLQKAHNKAATGVALSKGIDGLMMSCGLDGKVMVWDVKNGCEGIFAKDMKADKLFCGTFYEDNPWLLALGSSVGEMVIWDLGVAGKVSERFANRSIIKPSGLDEEVFIPGEDKDG